MLTMGKRGPAPKPKKVLEMRGSWRAKRNPKAPEPDVERPPCPKWLPKEARRVWDELAPVLLQMKVLARADRNALARYAITWARWREAEETIQKEGQVIVKWVMSRDGEPVEAGETISPWVQVAARLADQLGRIEREFGLTPSARTQVKMLDGENSSEAQTKRALLRLG